MRDVRTPAQQGQVILHTQFLTRYQSIAIEPLCRLVLLRHGPLCIEDENSGHGWCQVWTWDPIAFPHTQIDSKGIYTR